MTEEHFFENLELNITLIPKLFFKVSFITGMTVFSSFFQNFSVNCLMLLVVGSIMLLTGSFQCFSVTL